MSTIIFIYRYVKGKKRVTVSSRSRSLRWMLIPQGFVEPKKHETRIRMSDEDVELLASCCKKTGMTKTDVMRQGIREVYANTQK